MRRSLLASRGCIGDVAQAQLCDDLGIQPPERVAALRRAVQQIAPGAPDGWRGPPPAVSGGAAAEASEPEGGDGRLFDKNARTLDRSFSCVPLRGPPASRAVRSGSVRGCAAVPALRELLSTEERYVDDMRQFAKVRPLGPAAATLGPSRTQRGAAASARPYIKHV